MGQMASPSSQGTSSNALESVTTEMSAQELHRQQLKQHQQRWLEKKRQDSNKRNDGQEMQRQKKNRQRQPRLKQQPQQSQQQQQQSQQRQPQQQQSKQRQPQQQSQERQAQQQQPQRRQSQQQPQVQRTQQQQQYQQSQPQLPEDETWSQVLQRGKRGGPVADVGRVNPNKPRWKGREEQQRKLLQKRKPRGEAVVVSKVKDETRYTDLIKLARARVSPADCGVETTGTRYTKKGELIITVTGMVEQVQTFAAQLQAALGEEAVVRQPQRRTKLLILDVEESCSNEELEQSVSATEEVKVVSRRDMGRGCQMAQVQVSIPLALSTLAKKTIKVGWSQCRVRSLEKKDATTPRCYKCLHRGHIAAACTGEAVGNVCYRCGEEGHKLRDCVREPRCPICVKIEGRCANHAAGQRGCVTASEQQLRSERPRGGGRRRRE